jgi:hypothetical protein
MESSGNNYYSMINYMNLILSISSIELNHRGIIYLGAEMNMKTLKKSSDRDNFVESQCGVHRTRGTISN